MKLCVHADYVSEAEGALLKLQQCEAGSKRQAYTLDAATSTVHLRNAPEFCLHSVDTSLHSGQPVLVLRCPQQMTKSAADNDSEFVGHPLTSSDKAPELCNSYTHCHLPSLKLLIYHALAGL